MPCVFNCSTITLIYLEYIWWSNYTRITLATHYRPRDSDGITIVICKQFRIVRLYCSQIKKQVFDVYFRIQNLAYSACLLFIQDIRNNIPYPKFRAFYLFLNWTTWVTFAEVAQPRFPLGQFTLMWAILFRVWITRSQLKLQKLERLCASCGCPPPPHDYPYYWPVHVGFQARTIDQFIWDPKSKQDKVKVTNLNNLQNFNFVLLKKTLHATHLLKLFDDMCKYVMNPVSILEDTGRTRFCPQTDRRIRWNQYTPINFVEGDV